MIIFPAIDIIGGQCVRLVRGDYATAAKVAEDPLETAKKFEAAGAEWIHMVDLDGAKAGYPVNTEIYQNIAQNTGLKVEVGGGIRTLETAEKYLSAGVRRVIFGTAAVTDPELCQEAAQAFGEKAAVGVDLRDGMVAIRGWTEKSQFTFESFCDRIREAGICTLIVTDISRDGAMKGANLSLYRTLSAQCDMRIIASGGVSTLDDVRSLRDMGVYGAIIGKAYYTGAIDLSEALRTAGGEA